MSDAYAYWNTPDESGVTRRQRKWAEKVGVDATPDVLAALPCLGQPWAGGPCCTRGSCVTCEARATNDESQ
jgi:hypothetical protein